MNLWNFLTTALQKETTGTLLLLALGLLVAGKLANDTMWRSLRALMVIVRGWPPAHLDQDGEPKEDDDKCSHGYPFDECPDCSH